MIETGFFAIIMILSILFIYSNFKYDKEKDILHN